MYNKKHIIPTIFITILLLAFLIPYVQAEQQPVYYLDASQGIYYAINTNGDSYRVFYNSQGQIVYVTAYLWDANNKYIIFQSPINGRLYIRKEAYTLSTLSTVGWFTSLSFAPTPQVTLQTQCSSKAFINGRNLTTLTLSNPQLSSITYTNNTLYANLLWSYSVSSLTYYTWYSCPTNAWYVEPTTISFNLVPILQKGFVLDSLSISNVRVYGGGDDFLLNYISGSYYYGAKISSYSIASPTITLSVSAADSAFTSGTEKLGLTYSLSVKYAYPYAQGNTVTYPNFNVVIIYDSLEQLATTLALSTSTYVYALFTQDATLTFSKSVNIKNAIVIPLNTTQISTNVKSPNPASYLTVLSAWCPTFLIQYGTSKSFLVFYPPQISNVQSLQAKLVYNYPIKYSIPQTSYLYAEGDAVASMFAIQGSATSIGCLNVVGNVSLSNYMGSSLLLKVSGSFTVEGCEYGNITTSNDNYLSLYVLSQNAQLHGGSFSIYSVLVLCNIKTEYGYSITLGDITLQQWNIDSISYTVTGEITGSWSYRLPIYVTLAEMPQYLTEKGFIFRFQLPLKAWVTSGLLSSALEDLLFVDANMKPLPFYLYDFNNGTVYVRYDNPITSSSIIIYVLLRNVQLWGSGNGFSSLTATFDLVNPKEFVDDFGFNDYYTYLAYNLVVIRPMNTTVVKFGKTWFDFVAVKEGTLYEQHGSTTFYSTNANVTFSEAYEVIAYISKSDFDDVLIWINGEPAIAFSLKDFNASYCYYIGYKNVQGLYAGRMLLYSYSIGSYQGQLPKPQTVSKTQTVTVTSTSVDWFSLFGMVAVLLFISIAIRFATSGISSARKEGGSVFP